MKALDASLFDGHAQDGVFSYVTDVQHMQRVNTAGGIATPDSTCAAAKQDTDARVDYTAMYYFWGKP